MNIFPFKPHALWSKRTSIPLETYFISIKRMFKDLNAALQPMFYDVMLECRILVFFLYIIIPFFCLMFLESLKCTHKFKDNTNFGHYFFNGFLRIADIELF
uniref:Uncharacterized protein n=1 Tax=Cacopsylla melanoneura TaxID=428564 RepID=A0A8D8UL68_9HEMI